MSPVLGIDPGTRKCGYALVTAVGVVPLERGIVATETLEPALHELVARFAPRTIAIGGGTHTREIERIVRRITLPIAIVDERETTLRARARYFETYPPRGWRRLIPRGMLLPPVPIDDFAAILIAERFLAAEPAS